MIGEPLKHPGPVYAAVFSPGGQQILTRSADRFVRLWDLESSKIKNTFEHQRRVKHTALSSDGKTLLTTCRNNTARLWHVSTGEPVGEPIQIKPHPDAAGDHPTGVFSPDSKRVVLSYRDEIRIVEAATARQIGQPRRKLELLRFAGEGQFILTRNDQGHFQRWSTDSGEPVGETLTASSEPEWYLGIRPDGEALVTGRGENVARLWETATGNPIGEPLRGEGLPWKVAFSPDSRVLLTYGNRSLQQPGYFRHESPEAAQLWDAATARPIGLRLEHPVPVGRVYFSPDSQVVLTSTYHQGRLWHVSTGDRIGTPIAPEFLDVVQYSPDSRFLLVGSRDKTASLWDTRTGDQNGATLEHDRGVTAAMFTPDSQRVVTCSFVEARFWNTATGDAIGQPIMPPNRLWSPSLTADGSKFVVGGGNHERGEGQVQVWDLEQVHPIGLPVHHRGAGWMRLSPNGETFFTKSRDKIVKLWDTNTRELLQDPWHGCDRAVYSPNGDLLLLAAANGTHELLEAATGMPVGLPLQHRGWSFLTDFSPNGTTLISGSRDGTAKLVLKPVPRGETPERLTLWIQLTTGLELGDAGGRQILDAATWRKKLVRFHELGGTPNL